LKKVLVVSKGIFHPTLFCRMQLCRTIGRFNLIETEASSDLKSLDGITPEGFDAVVLYFHEKKVSDSVISSLKDYTEAGGLLVCIHGALASFKEYPEYLKLTGSRFTGHGEICEMNIKGFVDFSVTDEPYEFELSDDCKVLLESEGLPVCWVRKSGLGHVAGLSPGHRLSTMKNHSFQNVIEYILNEYSCRGD